MKQFVLFLKTTILGGVIFLVPVVVIIVITVKALQFASKVAVPMASFIPQHYVSGVMLANIIAATFLILVCFMAGLVARTSLADRFVHKAETKLLGKLPGYSFFKQLVESLSDVEDSESMHAVKVNLDDLSQIGFEVERLEDGRVVVFLPQSPYPWKGSVVVVDAARVELLPITMIAAADNIRMLGRGTSEILGVPAGSGGDSRDSPGQRSATGQ